MTKIKKQNREQKKEKCERPGEGLDELKNRSGKCKGPCGRGGRRVKDPE
jgi:hypothetical protein